MPQKFSLLPDNHPKQPKSKKEKDDESATDVWEAYANAIKKRWGSMPNRGKTVNRILKQLKSDLGSEAVEVVKYFVSRGEKHRYIDSMHSPYNLERDWWSLYLCWKGKRCIEDTYRYQGQIDPQCRKENIPVL